MTLPYLLFEAFWDEVLSVDDVFACEFLIPKVYIERYVDDVYVYGFFSPKKSTNGLRYINI